MVEGEWGMGNGERGTGNGEGAGGALTGALTPPDPRSPKNGRGGRIPAVCALGVPRRACGVGANRVRVPWLPNAMRVA